MLILLRGERHGAAWRRGKWFVDAEKIWTICACVRVKNAWEASAYAFVCEVGFSPRIHKYCIALFDRCMTDFHVSSTNSAVIFFLLSVILQAPLPDNYPGETPDQNHLILSAARLCLPRTILHLSALHASHLIPTLYIAALISSNAEITFTKCLCHLFFYTFLYRLFVDVQCGYCSVSAQWLQ